MRISVIGCGYLGAVHAASMVELGHEVIGVDVDDQKIALLSSGRSPFYEPGFEELLDRGVASGRLRFSTDVGEARFAELHFVAVGTPQRSGSSAADVGYVDAAVTSLIPYLKDGDVVAGKSTVPVGTAGRLAAQIKEQAPTSVLAWNPEFLREGFAVSDTISPDRFVFGLPGDPEQAARADAVLTASFQAAIDAGTPVVRTDYATAELVKVAANAFLATKISFINAMAEIAEVTGADVTELADAIGYDDRIGRKFLGAGVGFGGGCLPKDIRAFAARAEELGQGESLAFLREVDSINLRRRDRVVQLVVDSLGGSPRGRRVAVLGLAFKPNSDDIRDSPALDIASRLHELGAEVRAYDPQAVHNARRVAPQLGYADGLVEVVDAAEVTVLVTEWAEFREADPAALRELVSTPTVIDGRNVLDPQRWRAAGWTYRGLGRR